MNLDAADGDKMLLQYTFAWPTSIDDADAKEMIIAQTELLQTLLNSTEFAGQKASHYVAQEGKSDDEIYSWVFYNDAMDDQNPLRGYGEENFDRLKAIQRSVDPQRVFTERIGGFKYE
jgi:hypothetical protein